MAGIKPLQKEKIFGSVELVPFFPTRFRYMALLIFILSFCINFNTVFNEYALDDGIVINDNAFTIKGFDGVWDIFIHDTFESVKGVSGQLSGGRYRPLSVATFAIEIGIFGKHPGISHLINALIYCGICLLLLYFLHRYIFKNNNALALVACIAFTLHPTHTEVVANIKGRDELLSFFLVLSALISCLKWIERKSTWFLVIAFVCFFLSLLSKESGIPFVVLIPLSLYFFGEGKAKSIFVSLIICLAAFTSYMFIRYQIIGMELSKSTEVMNAPFVLASAEEALATKILILGKYIVLLLYPSPLSYDYSYPQIPYVQFSDLGCLLSLLIHTFLIIISIKYFFKKHIVSYSILFYFGTLALVSNFLFDVGAPMNDRFLFQPSLGFSIAFALFFNYIKKTKFSNKFLIKTGIIPVSMMLIFVLYGIKTVSRNAEWKNNETLFLTDALHAPRSAKTNAHASVAYIDKAKTEKDSLEKIKYLNLGAEKAFAASRLYPGYADAYINLGNVLAQLGRCDEAKTALDKAKKIYPNHNVLKLNYRYLAVKFDELSVRYFKEQNIQAALQASHASVECDPSNANSWYNLGGYYLSQNNKEKAIVAWTNAHQLAPENKEIEIWLDRISK